MAMTYGNVYVAQVAFGAKDAQTVKAFLEAESYPGTSLVIAYSPCIAHGYDLAIRPRPAEARGPSRATGRCTASTRRRIATGETPLLLDTAPIKSSIAQFMRNEARFRMVEQQDPERFRSLLAKAEREVRNRFQVYENLAKLTIGKAGVRRHRHATDSRARADAGRERPEEATMDLTTRYLGLTLPHPFMPGASPMVDDLDLVRRLEDAGAAAIVMHSLFEEQITREEVGTIRQMEIVSGSYPEALTYFPEPATFQLGPERYLDQRTPAQAGRAHPRDRVAERRDAGRMGHVRDPHRRGRRRRARAEPL